MSNLPIAPSAGRIPVSIGSGVLYSADPSTTPAVDFVVTDAINNDLTTVLTLDHETTGVPASGIGTRLALNTENSANASIVAGSIAARLTTVTATTPVGKFEIATVGHYSVLSAYAVRTVFSATYGVGGATYVFGVNDNVSGATPLNFVITGASAFGGSGDAGAAGMIRGGTGDGAGAGGNLRIYGGVAGASGAASTIFINAGDSGAGSVVGGGNVLVAGGNAGAAGTAAGGYVDLRGGIGRSVGPGGNIYLTGGAGGTSGQGGDVIVSGGDAGGSATAGGSVSISGGAPTTTGTGGGVAINGHDAVDAAGNGGTIVITSGSGLTTGSGGGISIKAGDSSGTGGGGDVIIEPGLSSAGTNGSAYFSGGAIVGEVFGIRPNSTGAAYSIYAASITPAPAATSVTCNPSRTSGVATFTGNAATFTITNNLVDGNSHILYSVQSISPGCYVETIVPSADTITINLNAASAIGLTIHFLIINQP